jgi:hypothetical protein
LNESSAEGIDFFAALGAIRIDESRPAPVLDTVVRSNAWSKETARERRQAQRDMETAYDWDTYVSGQDTTSARWTSSAR